MKVFLGKGEGGGRRGLGGREREVTVIVTVALTVMETARTNENR